MKSSNRLFFLPYDLYYYVRKEDKLKNHEFQYHSGFFFNYEFSIVLPYVMGNNGKFVRQDFEKVLNEKYGLIKITKRYNNLFLSCYINNDETKLYFYTSNVFKRGKHKSNKRVEYRIYSIDCSIIEALKDNPYEKVNVYLFSKTFRITYWKNIKY